MYYLALRDDLQLLVYAPQYPIICAVSRRCLCIICERVGQIERDSGTAVFFGRHGSRLRFEAQYWPARDVFLEIATYIAAVSLSFSLVVNRLRKFCHYRRDIDA